MRNKVKNFTAGVMCLLTVSLALPVNGAPPEGKGKTHKHAHDKKHKSETHSKQHLVVSIRFEDIRRYAVENQLVGYKPLPPGIRKNLARGKPLPPGIAKKLTSAPFIAKLPKYEGYEWRVSGTDLLLVVIATAVIEEVFAGVFD